MHLEFCIGTGVVVFFFFSSRRRHTRSLRDWSSDVCSSDLRHDRAILILVAGRLLRAAPEEPHLARRNVLGGYKPLPGYERRRREGGRCLPNDQPTCPRVHQHKTVQLLHTCPALAGACRPGNQDLTRPALKQLRKAMPETVLDYHCRHGPTHTSSGGPSVVLCTFRSQDASCPSRARTRARTSIASPSACIAVSITCATSPASGTRGSGTGTCDTGASQAAQRGHRSIRDASALAWRMRSRQAVWQAEHTSRPAPSTWQKSRIEGNSRHPGPPTAQRSSSGREYQASRGLIAGPPRDPSQ